MIFFLENRKETKFEKNEKEIKVLFYFCHFQKKRENKTQNASLNKNDISFDQKEPYILILKPWAWRKDLKTKKTNYFDKGKETRSSSAFQLFSSSSGAHLRTCSSSSAVETSSTTLT